MNVCDTYVIYKRANYDKHNVQKFEAACATTIPIPQPHI